MHYKIQVEIPETEQPEAMIDIIVADRWMRLNCEIKSKDTFIVHENNVEQAEEVIRKSPLSISKFEQLESGGA